MLLQFRRIRERGGAKNVSQQHFRLFIPFEQHAPLALPPHTKHHNLAQPAAMALHSAQHDEAQQAIHSTESSIADYQDQDDVAEENVNQAAPRGKLWDACKRGYHFYQEKAFQEGSTQGTTCGS
jgi:hypothetical protein